MRESITYHCNRKTTCRRATSADRMKRPKRLAKILKRGAIMVLSLAIVIALIGFTVGPSMVAKRLNPHDRQTFPAVTPAVAALHRSLTIADLHADAELKNAGLTEAEIGKIMGLNVMRVLAQVLPENP
jgi:hypothetical protein